MPGRKDIHTIDTRFTWSGDKAKAFIELAKKEYGKPLPYGAIRQLIRLACARFLEDYRREKEVKEFYEGYAEAGKEARRKEKVNETTTSK